MARLHSVSEFIIRFEESLKAEFTAQVIEALWHEYEEGTTAEAKMVKDFDKLEMIVQAHEYETSKLWRSSTCFSFGSSSEDFIP